MEHNQANLVPPQNTSVQHQPTIDDALLGMLQHPALLTMQIAKLQQNIELALDTGNKALFMKSTNQLKQLEWIYNR